MPVRLPRSRGVRARDPSGRDRRCWCRRRNSRRTARAWRRSAFARGACCGTKRWRRPWPRPEAGRAPRSVPAYQHHGDIVRATAVERRGHQSVDALLGAAFAVREHAGDAAVVDLFGQAIAAQQQLHARRQLAGHRLDVQRLGIGHAQRLGDHVALRMAARLVDADRALADQFLDVAVVLGKLGELAVAPDVDTAVADPGDFEPVAVDARRDHGGAHGQRVLALARGADDLFVGDADRLRQGRALAGLAHDRLPRQGAGDFTVLVPAHAVGDQPQAQFAVAVVGVFVELAAQADVREVAELDHALAAFPGGAGWENGGSGRERSAGMWCAGVGVGGVRDDGIRGVVGVWGLVFGRAAQVSGQPLWRRSGAGFGRRGLWIAGDCCGRSSGPWPGALRRCAPSGRTGWLNRVTALRQIRKNPLAGAFAYLAERGGFEPPRRYKRLPDFESGTFNRSATSPVSRPRGPGAQ